MAVGLTGCTGLTPLSAGPCTPVREFFTHLDAGEYDAAARYFPADHTGISQQEYAELLANSLLAAFEARDVRDQECVCTDEIDSRHYDDLFGQRVLLRGSPPPAPSTAHVVHTRVTVYDPDTDRETTSSILAMAYRIDGDGWYLALGLTDRAEQAIQSYSDECG